MFFPDLSLRQPLITLLWMAGLSIKKYQVYKADFDEFDTDQSGALEPSEIAALLTKQMGSEPTKEMVEKFISDCDLNQDGKSVMMAVCDFGD